MTAHYKSISMSETAAERVLDGVDVAKLQGTPFTKAKSSVYRRFGKRSLDISLIILSAPAVIMIVAILAILVSLDGGNPFYKQKRIGRNGRQYTMWKLRSMVPDADARLDAYLTSNPKARIEWDRDQKLKQDPRITVFGRFLRKSSLDELPQLWNVFKGDMSLVGPRPMMPCQADIYPGTAYFHLAPGITGSWQVSARNASTFADRARFDTAYNQEISLWTDLKLLVATVRVVLRATGH